MAGLLGVVHGHNKEIDSHRDVGAEARRNELCELGEEVEHGEHAKDIRSCLRAETATAA